MRDTATGSPAVDSTKKHPEDVVGRVEVGHGPVVDDVGQGDGEQQAQHLHQQGGGRKDGRSHYKALFFLPRHNCLLVRAAAPPQTCVLKTFRPAAGQGVI